MDLTWIVLALTFAALAWFVWDTLKARESANAAMHAACDERGYLFLDDTVSLHSVRPVRDDEGRVKLRRIYDFQYSDTGHNRRDGTLMLIADRVAALDMAEWQQTRSGLEPRER
jgi:hypothetical protein